MSARRDYRIKDPETFYALVREHIGGEMERPQKLEEAIAKAPSDASPVDVVRDALGHAVARRMLTVYQEKAQANRPRQQL